MILRTLWAAVISDHCLRFDLKPTECICTVLWGACKTTHLSHRWGGNLLYSAASIHWGLRSGLQPAAALAERWPAPAAAKQAKLLTPAASCLQLVWSVFVLVWFSTNVAPWALTRHLHFGLVCPKGHYPRAHLLCCCLVFREERFLQGNPSNTAMLVQSFSDFTVTNFIFNMLSMACRARDAVSGVSLRTPQTLAWICWDCSIMLKHTWILQTSKLTEHLLL